MSTAPAQAQLTGNDPDADGFWSAVADGGLQLRRCTHCGACFVLPLPSCPECAGEPELIRSEGRGALYTWVVVHHTFDEDLARQVPYVVGAVELDEGARIFARVEGIDLAALQADVRLRAIYPSDPGRPPIVFVPEESGVS
ncbi:OB-fold domain-containing protein [Nocardia sp. NPDC049190]|uniref:Zn-ribbon domain-containing OB-fold protein n=1 Tax=Nocardia sp. NPDC049190 TaxID=3155650 RepID=UPI0033C840F6